MINLSRCLFSLSLLLFMSGVATAQSHDTLMLDGLLVGAADPTAVATQNDKGETVYYVAATGRGVQLLRSTDLIHWESTGRVFETSVPEWALLEVPGTRGIWAPDLSYHDGLYHVYYSISTFGSKRSVIGLAVNKSLDPASDDYHWEDRGKVIESLPGVSDFNAIDPALLVDQQGRWLLFWGSYWEGLKVVEIDPSTGKPKEGAKFQPVAARPNVDSHAIEAPYVAYHKGYYYQYVSWDSCCDGARSTYKVMVGRSRDAKGPYLDADGVPMLDGGGTLVLESNERWKGTGHNGILTSDEGEWMVHHTYDVENLDAQRILQIRPLSWTAEGWPTVGEPISTP